MEGAALAANRQIDMAIVTAWHTACFALAGYAGKLKDKRLSDFLTGKSDTSAADDQRMQNARAIHFFQSLKARGVDVEITRTVN